MPDGTNINPWEIDWTKAAQAQTGKAPWEVDWSKVGQPPAPQYTAQSPFVVDPKTVTPEAFAEWRTANPGAYVKMPDGRVLRVPAPTPEEVAKEQAATYDTSGLEDAGPSTLGSFGRGVVGGVVPAAGGMVGMGAGAQLGAALGAPLAPVTAGLSIPIGGVVGAIAGGLGGGYLAGQAQDVALAQVPPVQKFLGQDPETRRADEAAHPYASFAGRLLPQAAFLRPSLPGHAVPEGAGVAQRILGSRATGPVVGGAFGAGQEAITEAVTEGHVDPVKVGIAGVAGAAMTKPTAAGQSLIMAGARPVQAGIERVAPGLGARVQPPPSDAPTPPPERPPVGSLWDIVVDPTQGDAPVRMSVFGYTDDGLVILRGEGGNTSYYVPPETLSQYGKPVAAPAASSPLALTAPPRALPPPATGYGEGFTMPPEGGAPPPEVTRTEFAPENVPPVEPPPATAPKPPEGIEQQDADLRAAVAEGRATSPDPVRERLAEVEKEITPDQTSVPRGTVVAPEGGSPDNPPTPVPAPSQQEAPAAAPAPTPERAPESAPVERPAEPVAETPAELIEQWNNEPRRPPEGQVLIGKNYRGEPIYEDARGIRTVDGRSGLRLTEPVILTGNGMRTADLPPLEYRIAEPNPAAPREIEYQTAVPPTEARPEAPLPNTEEAKTGTVTNGPTVSDEKHTKTGKDIYAVRFPQKPVIEGLGAKAKSLGGYWSSYRGGGAQPGWLFKTREAADRFADWSRSHLAMPQRLADAEAAGRAAGAAGTMRAINRDPVGQGLMQGAPDVSQADRVLKAWIQGWHQGQKDAPKAQPAPLAPADQPPPVPRGTGESLAPEEHPGLVIKSLETGKTTNIQPPGTRPPAAPTDGARPETPTGDAAKALFDEAQAIMRTLPNNMGAILQKGGKYTPGQQAKLDRLAAIDKLLPQTSPEWRRLMNESRAEYDATLKADREQRGAEELAKAREGGFEIGDKVGYTEPSFLPHIPGRRHEGVVRQSVDGTVYVASDGQRLDLYRNPWRKPEGSEPVVPGETESPATGTAEAHPVVQLATSIERKLESGLKGRAADVLALGPREFQELAERAFGSKLSEGKFTRAEMYDALELAVNRYIRAHADVFDPRADLRPARQMVSELQELKNSLPTQTVRAGEKDTFQQFSTPPDYAFAANWVAKIGDRDVVIEPSAGTGSLAVHAMNAKPEAVYVNELSKNRAPLVESLGPDRAFRENAEQLHNILPADVKPTVVVMNPPFSQTAGRMGSKTVLTTGAQHVEQALKRLEPGGRLVAIVGRGMRAYTGVAPSGQRFGEGTGASFRSWWDRIGREYDVRANVGVPGSVYGKYGTTFGTQLLVIDKNPPSGRPAVIADAESIPDLMAKLEGVRDERVPATERTAAAEQLAAEPGGEAAPVGGQRDAGPEPTVPGAAAEPGVREGPAGAGPRGELPPGTGERGAATVRPGPEAGAGDALAPEQPQRGRPAGADRDVDARPGGREDLEGRGPESDAVVLRPEGEPGSVLPPSAKALAEQSPSDPPPEIVRVQEEAADPETAAGVTENVYEPYKPQRITIRGAAEHPTKLVQSAAMASVMPPEIDYRPKLPASIIKDGKLSAAQLEAVTYAGHAHSQTLPEVPGKGGEAPVTYRRGYFIGDGTGVGKGAQVAGILLDNWGQGRKKAVWLSESRDLIKDARRDWSWVGRDPKEVFDFGKVAKPGAEVKMPNGIGFLTYDTLRGFEKTGGKDETTGKAIKGKTRVDQIVEWVGKDFDGVIAFDESHNLANSIQERGSRGVKDPAAKALAGIELQQRLPNARVVYVSATGATEVMNLAYAERLGLWGPGTAFPSKREFISQISGGGVAAMELVARDMKAMGNYIARSLSYDGVEYDRVEHKLTGEQRQIYDELAGGWQEVLRNIEAALVETGVPDAHGAPQADRRQRSAALSAFWGAHQRFFNQIITAMQMPSVIKSIEADIKDGRQAVVQLVNTNEASQKRALSKARAEEADLEDLDMTPRDQLMQMIDKSFPTAQMEEYVDDAGNTRTRVVTDSAGNVVHNPEALAMKDTLLSKLGSIRVPDGPLEILINHFGHENVAEITGRKERVIKKLDKDGQTRSQVETRPGSANITEADAFQDGKKKVLVFSQAGMTGKSYHADLSSPSAQARRSHYMLQSGWRADKALQGLGRSHRTNQASAPIVNLVTTDLQGQKRFISSIARRLAQLGALTKGERRAGESGLFSARDNLESAEARTALAAFWRDLQNRNIQAIQPRDFERQTGLKLFNETQGATDPPEIPQFLNRLLSLKFDMQNRVFDEFSERLNAAIDHAAATGTLDVGTETLKADRISKTEDRVVHTDPQSGAETRYVKLKVENKTKPTTFAQVSSGRGRTGGKTPEFYVVSKRSGKIMAVSEARDITDPDGRIKPQYRVSDPLRYDFTDRYKLTGPGSERYWERVDDKAQAKQLWDAQVKALPEYMASDAHLITGAILPIWDRLGQGMTQVYRLQTDAGEKMLGRTIPDSQIDGVLKALGAEGERQYAPADVASQIMAGGRATLANGWSLRRSVVANEPRIELVGPNYTHEGELSGAGVFTERIGYSTRYFVPTGEQAAKTLESVLARRPITEMVRGSEGGVMSRLMRDESGAGVNPFGGRDDTGKKSYRLEWDEASGSFQRVETGGAGGRRRDKPPEPPAKPPTGPGGDEERAALRRIMHVDDGSLMDRVRGFIDTLREDTATRFKQGFLDDTAGLERAEKAVSGGKLRDASISPTVMTRLTRNIDSVMSTVVGMRQGDGYAGGAIRYNSKDGVFETADGSKPFAAIFKPIFDAGLQDQWALWAITNRAKRLMAEGRERNVSAEDIDRYADLDKKYLTPDGTNLFRETLKQWRDLNTRTLDLAESVGLINKDQRALWENEDYVPFFRALDDDAVLGGGKAAKGVANVRSGIHRLEGGEEKVANIYENMVRNLSAMIDRSMKNEAMRRVIATLSGTDALTPLSKMARENLQTPEAIARLEAMGLDPANMSVQARVAASDLFGMIAKKDPNLVSVMENGKPQYYRVNDPLLLRSLVSMGPQAVNGIVMTLLGGAKKVLTHAVTIDPAFMLSNLMRDSLHSWVVTGHGFTPGVDTMKGFMKTLRNDPSSMAIMAGGGGGGHFYAATPARVRQALEKKDFKGSVLDSPRKLWMALENIGRASEQANRVAIYEAALKEGASKAEAVARSQDMLNFTMRGDFAAMRFLTETVPFLNARVQGMYRLYRGAREKPASFLLRGSLITAAALALWAANKDDERYKALEDWDRQNYFHFFIGDHHFRLPQPFEVGALFATIPEMLLNYSENGRTKELARAFSSMMLNQLHLNPVPQLLKPVVDLYANKDSFTGRPIISASEERLVPELRYGPNTSQTMVALAGSLGVSPDQAEHLLRGYGGTVAMYLLAAADAAADAAGLTTPKATKRWDQVPLVSRFVREEPALGTRWLTEFYNLKTEVDQLTNSLKQYQKQGDAAAVRAMTSDTAKMAKISLHKGAANVAENLGVIRQAMTRIDRDQNMSPAEKRRRLDALIASRNKLAESVRPMLKRVEGLRATP